MAQRGTDFADCWKVLHERIAATQEIWTRDALEYHGTSVSFDRTWS